MTELSFLLDLVLNEKLSKSVKTKIVDRIKFIESQPVGNVIHMRPQPTLVPVPKELQGQAPSTIAAMQRQQNPNQAIINHQISNETGVPVLPTAEPPPAPGAVVASQAAAQAIASRNEALAKQLAGNNKPDPGRTGPRKF